MTIKITANFFTTMKKIEIVVTFLWGNGYIVAGLLYGYRAHDNSRTFSEALHGLLASCSSYRTTCPLIHTALCIKTIV